MSPIRAIAFDCYGTLIDFDTNRFIEAFDAIARDQGIPADGKTLWDHWLAHLRTSTGEFRADPAALVTRADPPFAPYRDTWVDHFRAAFDAAGAPGRGDPVAATARLHGLLAEAPAYPEVHGVVGALRPRYRLALVSNADDDWLYACLRKNDLADWEVVVSSEEVQSYKPRPTIYQEALRRLALPADQVLYVGDSPYADVFGAQHAGMPVIWINRRDEKLPENVPPPAFTIATLAELPRVLTQLEPEGAK